ncbi:MAG: 2-amino-4-hydroxy-6-hydroxymethyldihydropteridine diphosphokinase [Alphaproteobacteria bacterium]
MSLSNAPSTKVALALGSNMGDRMAALRQAVAALEPYITNVETSQVYETDPLYVTDQPAFLNAALIGETKLPPLVLLWAIKDLESELGRQPTFHYGPRTLDIDILFYDDQSYVTPELTLPHARMAEREFVLRPLADIAPNWKHPQTGLTVKDMLKQIPSSDPKSLGPLLS